MDEAEAHRPLAGNKAQACSAGWAGRSRGRIMSSRRSGRACSFTSFCTEVPAVPGGVPVCQNAALLGGRVDPPLTAPFETTDAAESHRRAIRNTSLRGRLAEAKQIRNARRFKPLGRGIEPVSPMKRKGLQMQAFPFPRGHALDGVAASGGYAIDVRPCSLPRAGVRKSTSSSLTRSASSWWTQWDASGRRSTRSRLGTSS
jgi:hypothetical protein